MNKTILSKSGSTGIRLPRKAMLVAAMFFALSPNAFSSGLPVFDGAHTIQAYITHLLRLQQQVTAYQAEIQHYMQQVTHMQQQLISIGGLPDVSMPMTDNFDVRDPNYGMEAACPGADGSISVISMAQSFQLDLAGKIKEQQGKICQRMVMAKNTQYNEAVKMLKTIREQDKQLQIIAKEREEVGTDEGKLAANDNKLRQYLARSSTSMQYSTTVIQAYETYINALKDNQELLTKQAMSGDNGNKTFAESAAQKFVQGAVLEAALRKLDDRDR